ncbi:MAG: transketolase, partial [Melioribacteraceae bacterium]|nr:transketolase [Melioribacteraceae bacterium]
LVFCDYMKPAIRLAAMMGLPVVYVFTHDSIGLGEDGPTHQPVEQASALRTIPGFIYLRPADANETSEAWKLALEHKRSPIGIALTRQKLTILDRNKYASAEGVKSGAYIIKDSDGFPDLILLASGSEVEIALNAAEELDSLGIKTRVVNFVSWEIFEMQSDEYKNSVLPANVTSRISIEAAIKMGWEKYVGLEGDYISLETYGASAPYQTLFEKYGFIAENIVEKGKKLVEKNS